jgi:hypothetical protein
MPLKDRAQWIELRLAVVADALFASSNALSAPGATRYRGLAAILEDCRFILKTLVAEHDRVVGGDHAA